MDYHREEPYNQLPLLPPKADLETSAVLKKLIQASRGLAELKGKTNTIPNPYILLNTITLQEAQASSEIENILTTTDELYRELTLEKSYLSSDQKEVLNYQDALWSGYQRLKKGERLSVEMFMDVASRIKGVELQLRDKQSTVIARELNRGKVEVIYTPPRGKKTIEKKLQNLEQFLYTNQDGLDVITKMVIAHYQFEAIHPFHDGNGRAGRIVNILYLVSSGLLEHPVLYLSHYIIKNKPDYYRLLREVTEQGKWEDWLVFMIEGITETTQYTCSRIDLIKELLEQSLSIARKKLPAKVYSKELIELTYVRPYCKIKHLVDAGIAKRQTAAEYLNELEQAKLLTSQIVGREKIFINQALVRMIQN